VMKVYVTYEKWFNRKDLRDTLKSFPTIFGTIIIIYLYLSKPLNIILIKIYLFFATLPKKSFSI
jgi:hypothetical protein